MRVDTRPRRKNSGRANVLKRAPGFLSWLRSRQCYISTIDPQHICEGKVRACHFDPWGDKGMASKVSDRAALPMCDGAHREQTDVLGWPKFQEKYGFDGRHVVVAFWMDWPGRLAWEAKQDG